MDGSTRPDMAPAEAEFLGHTVLVAGFRDVELGDPADLIEGLRAREELKGLCFQLLNADMVAGPEHVFVSVINALRAFELGLNVSSDLGLEILTFASGQRQISKAIRSMGLRKGKANVAAVIVAKSREEALRALEAIARALAELGGAMDDGVLEVREEKAVRLMRTFGLTGQEISACGRDGLADAVKALVVEKVALSMAYR